MMKKLLCILTILFVSLVQSQNITVTGLGNNIAGDGTNVPAIADDTEFGSVDVIAGSVTHTFTITNILATPILLTANTVSAGYTISNSPVGLLGAGLTTTFDVTFDPSLPAGLKAGVITVDANDFVGGTGIQNFIFNVQGTATAATAPEIDVTGNGVSIASGDPTPSTTDDTDFGQVDIVGGSVTRTFTINNTGTAPLNLTGASLVFLAAPAGTFTVTNFPTTPIPAAGSTTFDITFDPSAVGVVNATVLIQNDDADESNYFYAIRGEGIASAPEIEVTGNGTSITNGDPTPDLADHTDFGQVDTAAGTLTRTFTINNTGNAPLTLTGGTSVIVSPAEFTVTNFPTSPIPANGSTTFDVTFDPSADGIFNGTVLIQNDDADESNFFYSIRGEGITVVAAPEMNVTGLGNTIASGDVSPDVTDDTDFGQVDISSGSVSHTFTIENTGTLDLTLSGAPIVDILGADAAEFSVSATPTTPVAAAGSTVFTITFDPSSLGVKSAIISITNDDADENPYFFSIEGEGIDVNVGTPLLITQYYEGAGNNQWIEVKNVSASTVLAGTYYLALYSGFNTLVGNISTQAPDANVSIGTMAPGAVRLFSNPSAVLPLGANIGPATITTTAVCTFSGDDVILISSNNGVTSYANRIDIMGVVDAVTPKTWGADVSFIKGCGTTESPTTTFDATVVGSDVTVNDYIELTTAEVDAAKPDTNIALGTQGIGATTWTGAAWNNAVPDRTRNAIISGTYNASEGSFESCDLTVTGTINLNGGTSNYVEIHNDLTITGSFVIGDTESLYFGIDNEDATISGSITKQETTTSLTNLNDFTYWTSPVTNASISSVFAGTDLNRVFYWDQGAGNAIPGGGVEVLGEWIVASGTMIPVKGYIAEGPTAGSYPLSHSVSFSGTPNNGVVSLSGSSNMVFNNDGNTQNDYNLIGNPYPSGINADTFINLPENSTIDGTLWFWTHNTPVNNDPVNRYTSSDYASYNLAGGTAAASGGATPNGFVSSSQGFMIRAQAIGPGVIFNNAMRERNNNTQFFRPTNGKSAGADEKDRVWLNAETTDGGAFNQILVGFFENATDDHDRGYDGIKNGAGWINLYSKIDTVKYGIQGLASFNEDKTVPIGFDTFIDEALTYKISIDRTEGALSDNDIYLVDNVLDITHDLKVEGYEFDLDEIGNHPNRFTLRFTKSTLGVDDQNLENDFVISNLDNAFEVRSNTVINQVKVYDIMGRLLIEKSPNQSRFEINTSSIRKGTVLIIKASFENGAEANKKAIKY